MNLEIHCSKIFRMWSYLDKNSRRMWHSVVQMPYKCVQNMVTLPDISFSSCRAYQTMTKMTSFPFNLRFNEILHSHHLFVLMYIKCMFSNTSPSLMPTRSETVPLHSHLVSIWDNNSKDFIQYQFALNAQILIHFSLYIWIFARVHAHCVRVCCVCVFVFVWSSVVHAPHRVDIIEEFHVRSSHSRQLHIMYMRKSSRLAQQWQRATQNDIPAILDTVYCILMMVIL